MVGGVVGEVGEFGGVVGGVGEVGGVVGGEVGGEVGLVGGVVGLVGGGVGGVGGVGGLSTLCKRTVEAFKKSGLNDPLTRSISEGCGREM